MADMSDYEHDMAKRPMNARLGQTAGIPRLSRSRKYPQQIAEEIQEDIRLTSEALNKMLEEREQLSRLIGETEDSLGRMKRAVALLASPINTADAPTSYPAQESKYRG